MESQNQKSNPPPTRSGSSSRVGSVRSAGRCTANRRMPGGTGSISTTASQIVGERVQRTSTKASPQVSGSKSF